MLSVTVRRSTLTIRSTIGIRMKRPGPFGSGKRRPSRKTIPRSYSRATLIAEIKNSTSSKSRIAAMIKTALMASPFEVCEEGTGQSECAPPRTHGSRHRGSNHAPTLWLTGSQRVLTAQGLLGLVFAAHRLIDGVPNDLQFQPRRE